MELVAIAVLATMALAVFGLLWAVASLVCWVLVLPFKLLGFIFKSLAVVLALPVILVAVVIGTLMVGVVGVTVFGVGLLMFLLPAAPFALIALAVWWIVRRRGRAAASMAR